MSLTLSGHLCHSGWLQVRCCKRSRTRPTDPIKRISRHPVPRAVSRPLSFLLQFRRTLSKSTTLTEPESRSRRDGWIQQHLKSMQQTMLGIWRWCRWILPLALFACMTHMFRAPLVNDASYMVPYHSQTVYAATSKSIAETNISWADTIRYKFQQVMSKQLFGKLSAVLLAAAPIVVIGGLSYKVVTGDKLRESMFKAYAIMGDVPGADAVEADNPVALFICNMIFLAGMLTVAVTLGIVCDDISTFVSEVRHGNYQMVEDGHTVILNVNRLLGPVLRQIAEASKERGSFHGAVIILADVDKDELEGIVAKETEGLDLQIFTRNGCTHDAMDLKRVAAGRAKCVIWLEPDADERTVAARRACAIASLKSLEAGKTKDARMVVQTSHDSVRSSRQLTHVPMAYRMPPPPPKCNLDVVELYEEEHFDRLLAQCALQPGLSGILSDILQHNEGTEFYLSEGISVDGMLYSDARRQFESAAVCGVFTPGHMWDFQPGTVQLNPPDDEVLQKNDRLIVLCDSVKQTTMKKEALPAPSKWVKDVQRHHSPCWSKDVVVLCLGEENKTDSGILESIGVFAPEGTHVTIVASSFPMEQRRVGNCRVSYVEGNPTSFSTLLLLDGRKVDSVVLAGLEDLPPRTADAQLISSLIQIQEVANLHWKDKDGFNVVSPLNFADTKLVADHLIEQGKSLRVPISLDVLVPNELTSGMLVQVAGAPILDAVFKDLVSEPGSEIYIRNASEFGLVGKGPIKSYEVADVVRKFGETFLGVLKEDKSFEIAPSPMSEHEYTENEHIIVLAQSFEPAP